MKATINGDGTLVLFPTCQVELFASRQLLIKMVAPTIIIDDQPWMNEPDYVKKVNKQNQTRDSDV